jgi:hypothetical protein
LEKNKLLPGAIIILAISIVLSSIWIGKSLKEVSNKSISVGSQQSDILGLEEAAKYLNISESQLISLTEGIGSSINRVKINDKYIFSKEGLSKWVQSTRLDIQK